ncbi:C-C motif chemokine 27b [Ictalurus punctatus]|uniref:C-C motif chemokine 27b n=1 Tax=Ictalurus punctatus TaxID=7998 RepID=A0A979FB60_ICTPU|nr:C-C motif chemokine 27b [Ictalurus punctatus]
MDFKILLLLLCITFISVQGETPQCCLSTAPLSRRILKRVEKVTIQRSNGRCEIDALVLLIRGKRLCAPMWQWKLLEQLKSSLIGQQRF